MIKIITPGSYMFDQPIVSLVKVSSRGLRGLDRSQFVKRAGHDFLPHLDQLRPGEEPLHIIAIGAYDRYGANRNGDAFDEETCRDRHHTFVKNAWFFRNHANKPHDLRYGRIIKSAYHEPMARIELLAGLFKTADAALKGGGKLGRVADLELEKMAAGKDIPTSMACVTNPATPTLTAVGYKRIADVAVGDLVLTHQGRWRPVTGLNRRIYTGEVLEVWLEGLPTPLELTADHPMYGKILQQYSAMKSGQRPPQQWRAEVDGGAPPFSWVHATHLEVDDRIACVPVRSSPDGVALQDVDLCGLLGCYVAEGSIGYSGGNPNTVVYTVNSDDWAVAGVPQLVGRLWDGVTCNLRPKKNCKVAFSLEVYSAELARFMLRYVGAGWENKRVPVELFASDDDCKLSFMGRWLDGDGWCDKKGLHWSSGNYGLILQGRDLLLSAGIPASIYKIDHAACETSGYENSGKEYTLNVSHFDASRLSSWSAKVAACPHVRDEGERCRAASLMAVGGSYAFRIKKLFRRQVEDVQTWNIEVADDASYSLMGAASHNCRVPHDICSHCHNKAASRAEYCDTKEVILPHRIVKACSGFGAANGLTKLGRDGKVQCVFNPGADFFDQSAVYRNADRISFGLAGTLTKAASAGVAGGAQLAELWGLRDDAPLAGWSYKAACQLRHLQALADAAPAARASDIVMTKRARQGLGDYPDLGESPRSLSQVFRALADEHAALDSREWMALMLGKEAAAEAGDEVAAQLPGIYRRMLDDPKTAQLLAQDNPYAPCDCTPPAKYQRWAALVSSSHGVAPSQVEKRAQLTVIRGAATPAPASLTPLAAEIAAASGGAEKLAREYVRYQIAFLDAQPESHYRTACGLLTAQGRLRDS
jgi:hypothetical protein